MDLTTTTTTMTKTTTKTTTTINSDSFVKNHPELFTLDYQKNETYETHRFGGRYCHGSRVADNVILDENRLLKDINGRLLEDEWLLKSFCFHDEGVEECDGDMHNKSDYRRCPDRYTYYFLTNYGTIFSINNYDKTWTRRRNTFRLPNFCIDLLLKKKILKKNVLNEIFKLNEDKIVEFLSIFQQFLEIILQNETEIEQLKTTIEELKYAPHGLFYQEAKEHFESLAGDRNGDRNDGRNGGRNSGVDDEVVDSSSMECDEESSSSVADRIKRNPRCCKAQRQAHDEVKSMLTLRWNITDLFGKKTSI